MIIRAKAPLRLGLAGGGTDVSPYCDTFGGAVLNITINMFAYCTIEPSDDGVIEFVSSDLKKHFRTSSCSKIQLEGELLLHKGVFNRIIQDYEITSPLSFKMTTCSDAPAGSGLGSSSTMVVAMIKAYMEWLNLPLGEYDMAKLAYQIEREDLQFVGGKQDQYAATFGGLNYMEFSDNSRVVVNPLRLKKWIRNELESRIVLYYTGTSRDSAQIILDQITNAHKSQGAQLSAMHLMKKEAALMKNAILCGNFDAMIECFKEGWAAKKGTSSVISNSQIESVCDYAHAYGAQAVKISGAGGGGFMMLICDPNDRYSLIQAMQKLGGNAISPVFSELGAQAWTIY